MTSRVIMGIAIVIIGAIFLLKNLGFFAEINWDIIWPVAIIAIGVVVIFRKKI